MTEGETLAVLKNFLDDHNRLRSYPAKEKYRGPAFQYLADKFEAGREYMEKEVGELLALWHTFGDPCLLRRELYERGLLRRDLEGRRYWRA